jgi:hypothetical protein
MTMQENPTLIVPRRNFLIRALGFTAAGATLPISIITADDAKALGFPRPRCNLPPRRASLIGPLDALALMIPQAKKQPQRGVEGAGAVSGRTARERRTGATFNC